MNTTKLRSMLSSETRKIIELTQYWQNTLENNANIPDDIAGKVRAIIGLSNLLINDKLQQFASLLETFESGKTSSIQKITLTDLEGFWDLVYIQIEDIEQKYGMLKQVQENNWEEIANEKDVGNMPLKKRSPLVSISNGTPKANYTPKSQSRLTASGSPKLSPRDHSGSARQRLAEAKSRIQQLRMATPPSNHLATHAAAQENIPSQDNTDSQA